MLGHATISQTMDTYSHVMPGMGDVAATALEEALTWPTAAKAPDDSVGGYRVLWVFAANSSISVARSTGLEPATF
jgi:hypothetical protein